MIPFITETIWWRLNDARPSRGLPMRLECPGSARLIHAAWPAAALTADPAEAVFHHIKEIITAIRQIRNDYKADAKRRLDASIRTPADLLQQVQANQATIELLAICRVLIVSDTLPPIAGAAHGSAAGCDIYIDDLKDADTQKERDQKLQADLARQIQTMKARLGNESYAAKAPPALVQQTRDQLAAAEKELDKLRNSTH
jgi:valyl-tRNA synthetase